MSTVAFKNSSAALAISGMAKQGDDEKETVSARLRSKLVERARDRVDKSRPRITLTALLETALEWYLDETEPGAKPGKR